MAHITYTYSTTFPTSVVAGQTITGAILKMESWGTNSINTTVIRLHNINSIFDNYPYQFYFDGCNVRRDPNNPNKASYFMFDVTIPEYVPPGDYYISLLNYDSSNWTLGAYTTDHRCIFNIQDESTDALPVSFTTQITKDQVLVNWADYYVKCAEDSNNSDIYNWTWYEHSRSEFYSGKEINICYGENEINSNKQITLYITDKKGNSNKLTKYIYFTENKPIITSISPNTLLQVATYKIIITGSGFEDNVIVSFADSTIEILEYIYKSSTQIIFNCKLSSATANGNSILYITNPSTQAYVSSSISISTTTTPISITKTIQFEKHPDYTTNNRSIQFKAPTEIQNASSWSWDFGDGSSSSEQNPSHTYTKAGNYKVKLVID